MSVSTQELRRLRAQSCLAQMGTWYMDDQWVAFWSLTANGRVDVLYTWIVSRAIISFNEKHFKFIHISNWFIRELLHEQSRKDHGH